MLLGSWPADKVDINDPEAVDLALKTLDSVGAPDACQVLAERVASQAALNTTSGLSLLRVLRRRASAAADQLAGRYATDAPTGDPGIHHVLTSLGGSGTPESVVVLAQRLADSADLTDIRAVAGLLGSLHNVGMDGLLRDQLGQVSLSRYEPADPDEVTFLLRTLSSAGAGRLVRELLDLNPAATVDVSDSHPSGHLAVIGLLRLLEERGDHQAAATLEARYADRYPLTDPDTLSWRYLNHDYPPTPLMRARLTPQLARAIVLTDTSAVSGLISRLKMFGADQALAVVLDRLAGEPLDLTNADAVLLRLSILPDTPEGRAAAERISLDSAEQVKLARASTVSRVIGSYRQLGCSQAVRILLARNPARNVPLAYWPDPWAGSSTSAGHHSGPEICLDETGIKTLIDALRQAGAQDQADLLATRAANAGMFAYWPETIGRIDYNRQMDVTLLSLLDHGKEGGSRYRYGRDPDGQPSAPWGWQNLLQSEESVTAELGT